MTKSEFEKNAWKKGSVIYWLDIEKEVTAVNFETGIIESSDGDGHHYEDVSLKPDNESSVIRSARMIIGDKNEDKSEN